EMLSGPSPLLMSKDPRVRMQKSRFDYVPPISREEVKAPASVFLLVDRMMALDPRQRYQTPSQLLDAVREARKDVEGGAVVPTTAAAGPATAEPALAAVSGCERLQKLQ